MAGAQPGRASGSGGAGAASGVGRTGSDRGFVSTALIACLLGSLFLPAKQNGRVSSSPTPAVLSLRLFACSSCRPSRPSPPYFAVSHRSARPYPDSRPSLLPLSISLPELRPRQRRLRPPTLPLHSTPLRYMVMAVTRCAVHTSPEDQNLARQIRQGFRWLLEKSRRVHALRIDGV